LLARSVDTLVFAGISTSGVVLSNVRGATDCDYRIVVLPDACADRGPDIHSFLVEKLFPGRALVTTVADLQTHWADPRLLASSVPPSSELGVSEACFNR
jgi:nicotinamidase-related amidase